ncbi:hypothetical protein PTKIN_Ptkin01aG0402300 [Pterospermum kingtungense]
MSETEKKVCVTGASGYIASWLVKLLLQHGYTVNATVRDPKDAKKTRHLLALDGANERLHLFKAELLEEGSFDSVVEGCIGVFHTASPCYVDVKDPQAEVIDPAVKGTLNVLRSCAKFPSIKRVIITSSVASVILTGRPLVDDVVVDETWFSDPAFCEESKQWYFLSKTLAEKAAWKFSEENGIDLVTIHPGVVYGPLLQPTLNATAGLVLNLIGAENIPNETLAWVDVRDVANAHVLAFENPSACGRYCVAGKAIHFSEVVRILRELYPTLNLPDKCEDEKQSELSFHVSQERAKSLGISFTSMEAGTQVRREGITARYNGGHERGARGGPGEDRISNPFSWICGGCVAFSSLEVSLVKLQIGRIKCEVGEINSKLPFAGFVFWLTQDQLGVFGPTDINRQFLKFTTFAIRKTVSCQHR